MSSTVSRIHRIAQQLELAQDDLRALRAERNTETDLEAYSLYWSTPQATIRKAYDQLCDLARKVDEREAAEVAARHGHYSDDELRYSARSRCACGAGLAYHKDTGMRGSWECSDILTGRALPASQPDSKEHTPALPFAFYEVRSEDQPSAQGETARPTIGSMCPECGMRDGHKNGCNFKPAKLGG